jgi:hypothetical protein
MFGRSKRLARSGGARHVALKVTLAVGDAPAFRWGVSVRGFLSARASSYASNDRRPLARWRGLAGGAAVLACCANATAADLPTRKSQPVEGLKVCNVAGMAGFVIPGSDTCLKISGYVLGEFVAGSLSKQYGLAFTGAPGASPVTSQELTPVLARDAIGYSARTQIDFDVRQDTAYGVLRGYAEILTSAGSGFEDINSLMMLNFAYVQFAGITAGKAGSFFSYLAGGPNWYDFYSPDRVNGNQPNLFAYTATFGNGFSATVSAEEPLGASVNNGVNGGFANAYYGMRYPDFVGALRVEQSWGSAQVSAVLHNTHALGVSGDTTNTWGGAVLAGVTFNLPSLGAGDRIGAQGVFSHAALGYSGIVNTAQSFFDQGLNINGNGTIFQLTDALNYAPGLWSTPDAWTAAAYYEHHFSPQFSLTPEASYASVHYSGSPAMISDDAKSFLGGVIAHWDPVAHLDFQFALMYQYTHQSTPASYVAAPEPFHPNSSGVAGNFEIVRDF